MKKVTNVSFIKRDLDPFPYGQELVPPLLGAVITILGVMVVGEVNQSDHLDHAIVGSKGVIDHVENSTRRDVFISVVECTFESPQVVRETWVLLTCI